MRPKIAALLEELSECTKKLIPSPDNTSEQDPAQIVDIQGETG